MTETILAIIISVLGASGFWSIILYMFQRKDKEKTLINESLLALLHDRVYVTMEKLIDKGSITEEEYDNLLHLYHPYRDLGGNGVCEKMMNEVQKLTITKEVKK